MKQENAVELIGKEIRNTIDSNISKVTIPEFLYHVKHMHSKHKNRQKMIKISVSCFSISHRCVFIIHLCDSWIPHSKVTWTPFVHSASTPIHRGLGVQHSPP